VRGLRREPLVYSTVD